MRFKATLILGVMLFAFSNKAQKKVADTIVFYENIPVDSIFELSKKYNKPIMLDAYTTWCGPCKMMARSTFKDSEVASFYNENFINVKMDMERGHGLEFNKLFPTNSYPTIYFINADSSVIRISKGYIKAPQFLEQGDFALHPEKTPVYKSTAEYNSGNRDTIFLAQHIQNIAQEYKPFNGEPQEYFKQVKNKSLFDTTNFKVFYFGVTSALDPWVEVYIEQLDALTKSYGARTIDGKSIDLINASLSEVIRNQDNIGLELLITRARSLMKNNKKYTPDSIEKTIRELYAKNVKN